jgi:hypothetical protein
LDDVERQAAVDGRQTAGIRACCDRLHEALASGDARAAMSLLTLRGQRVVLLDQLEALAVWAGPNPAANPGSASPPDKAEIDRILKKHGLDAATLSGLDKLAESDVRNITEAVGDPVDLIADVVALLPDQPRLSRPVLTDIRVDDNTATAQCLRVVGGNLQAEPITFYRVDGRWLAEPCAR